MRQFSNCPLCEQRAAHRRLPDCDHFFDCSNDVCGPTEISWMALQHIEQKVPEARAAIARGVAEARRHGYLVIIRQDLTQRHGMAGPDLLFEKRRLDRVGSSTS